MRRLFILVLVLLLGGVGLVALIQILAVGVVMFWINAKLAALAMLPIPLLILGAVIYTRRARDRYRLVRSAPGAMNSLLHDNISGIRQIKTSLEVLDNNL